MELFKTLLCNFIYYHRHNRFGDRDMPITLSFIMMWYCCFFIISGSDVIIYSFVTLPRFIYQNEMIIISPFVIVAFLYYRLMCGKRYIGILKNPKYYTKKRKIFSLCFHVGCLLYFFFSIFIMWASANHLIRKVI